MDLNTQQQAKLGLAIDLSNGAVDAGKLEDSKFFKELDMTKDQVEAFNEIVAISNGQFDKPLDESQVAKKYNVDLNDVKVLQEAQILTNSLDISKLEGSKIAELIGLEDDQLKQLVAIQNADFKAMKDTGVFKQIGFAKEQALLEGIYNAAIKDDLQSTVLETVSAFYAASNMYGSASADAKDMATTNPLAALANAGLMNGELSQDQINSITLIIDIATGNKKANQIGLDDIKPILVK